MSKATVVTERSQSPGPRPGECSIERKKLARAKADTSTPLGRPVDPEV